MWDDGTTLGHDFFFVFLLFTFSVQCSCLPHEFLSIKFDVKYVEHNGHATLILIDHLSPSNVDIQIMHVKLWETFTWWFFVASGYLVLWKVLLDIKTLLITSFINILVLCVDWKFLDTNFQAFFSVNIFQIIFSWFYVVLSWLMTVY